MAIEMGAKSLKLLLSSGAVKHNGQLRVYQRSIEGNDDVGGQAQYPCMNGLCGFQPQDLQFALKIPVARFVDFLLTFEL